jgi:D-alanyl-D-alanine carboxypeptidase
MAVRARWHRCSWLRERRGLAIAETAGGSLDGFIAAMQQSGQRLGMKDSTFADPAGLDDKASYKGGPG